MEKILSRNETCVLFIIITFTEDVQHFFPSPVGQLSCLCSNHWGKFYVADEFWNLSRDAMAKSDHVSYKM